MQANAKGTLSKAIFVLVVSLTICLGPVLIARGATDGQETMDEMCAGDMQWMVGWCIDMVTGGDINGALATTAFGALTPYVSVFEPIQVPGATATTQPMLPVA